MLKLNVECLVFNAKCLMVNDEYLRWIMKLPIYEFAN